MSSRAWAWSRLAGGAAILAVLIWRLGTGPILDGLRAVSVPALVAAAGIALITTIGAAWRWQIVARGLGVALPLPTAVAAYYRSQFLNTALPGGVLGDVHRGVSHGRAAGDVGRGLRAVGWERLAGQVVQGTIALVVLAVFSSPVRSSMPLVIGVVFATLLALAAVFRTLPRGGPSRAARFVRAASADVRDGLLARDAWPGITLASAVVVAGHTATFLIAARTAGVSASAATLLPLAVLVLLAMAVPANIAGWGPREGAAAWLFAAAGLGAGHGIAVATVYGVLVLVASLPGAAVAVAWRGRREPPDRYPAAPAEPVPAGAGLTGAVHG